MLSADLLARRLRAVQPHGEVVEQHLRRHRLDRVRARGVDAAGAAARRCAARTRPAGRRSATGRTRPGSPAARRCRRAAPCLALLFGLANTTCLSASATQRYSPLSKSALRALEHRVLAAHVLDVLLRRRLRRQVVRGPTDCRRTSPCSAGRPRGRCGSACRSSRGWTSSWSSSGRQLDHLGDLDADVALVHQVDRLVVHVLVQVALLLPVVDDLRRCPTAASGGSGT